MSVITDIAEAVKEELNAATFSQPFSAERHYQPLFELEEMKDLHVSVVPNSLTIHPLGRGQNQYDVKVDVAIQKKFAKGDNTELDPLMTLVEEIADHFRLKRLAGYTAAMWVKTENAPVYAQEHMEQLRQFTSVVTLTFRVQR
ncbi:MAG: hypothetical protein AB7F75_00790 [Planctomycetota bacterium]